MKHIINFPGRGLCLTAMLLALAFAVPDVTLGAPAPLDLSDASVIDQDENVIDAAGEGIQLIVRIVQVVILLLVLFGVGYGLFASWSKYRDERKTLGTLLTEAGTAIVVLVAVFYFLSFVGPYVQQL